MRSCTHVTRRGVIGSGIATAALGLSGVTAPGYAEAREAQLVTDQPAQTMPVTLEINGQSHSVEVDPRTTLLDLLREELGLSGTKKGCDHGQCGACTVLLNGVRINSCLALAVMHQGDDVTTIEGLGTPEALHPMQAAFVRHDGLQCGYCTPGQICSAIGMLAELEAGIPSFATENLDASEFALTDAEVRERMSGNICRCSAYPNILAAIRDVAEGGT